jgi:hypothetical protein
MDAALAAAAPSGGYARVLQSLSITQGDAVCKLAGVRRWWTVAASPEWQVHAPAACVLLFRAVQGRPGHL